MKTFAFALLFALVGCSNSPTTQCQPSIMCGMATLQVCCTNAPQCEYRVSGMTFPCAGNDCNAASVQVLALCADTGVTVDAAIDADLDAAADAGFDATIDAGP